MTDNNDLTDEEKDVLEKASLKIEAEFQDYRHANVEAMAKRCEDPDMFKGTFQDMKHVTDNQREILITLTAEISTTNDANKLLDIKTIGENHYHIPVPSGTDYTKSIDEFLVKLDKETENIAIKINTDGKKN